MKRKISVILCVLLFLVGLGVVLYPTVSNLWNEYRQLFLIADYERVLSEITPENFDKEWEAARKYNESHQQNNIYADAFADGTEDIKSSDYWKVLNITGDGTMGYLEIPKINVKLSINHGTSEEVLQTGIGHLNGTKLPIGGESNHTVLAAHRGLPSAKLFTDIDKLEIGDEFYLHVLDEVMAYQVDQILPMVDKDDAVALENALQVAEGEDYVTLFTCTPYGVNTHRLLVRGTRVPYEEGTEGKPTVAADSMVETIQDYNIIYTLFGVGLVILFIGFVNFLFRPLRKQRRKSSKEGKE